jgi:hypothetical protein
MDTTQEQISKPLHSLRNKWTMYYHLQNDESWALDSYKVIAKDFQYVEDVIQLNAKIPDYALYNCMFFCMKDSIQPMWEDPQNREGGCFSYRVLNKSVPDVWRKLMSLMCGESLCVDDECSSSINGITVSPKKNFCIIKIWLNGSKYKDVNMFVDIDDLSKEGCIFKRHKPEF